MVLNPLNGAKIVMVVVSRFAGNADWYIEHFPAVSVRHDSGVDPKLHDACTSTPAAGAFV